MTIQKPPEGYRNLLEASSSPLFEIGIFSVSPAVDTKSLEEITRHKVHRMLLVKGKLTQNQTKQLDRLPVSIICLNIQIGTILINCILHNKKESYLDPGIGAHI